MPRLEQVISELSNSIAEKRAYPIVDVVLEKRVLVLKHTNGVSKIVGRKSELKRLYRAMTLVPLDVFF